MMSEKKFRIPSTFHHSVNVVDYRRDSIKNSSFMQNDHPLGTIEPRDPFQTMGSGPRE